MRYYIIAGEASGDLIGSKLMNALTEEDAATEFRVWGGDLMKSAGGKIIKHYKDLAFMGFWEVVKNLKTILGNFKLCKNDIAAYSPDVLILIDYPGFNLRMAKWAKKKGIRVFYYVSPQIWAWHSSRVHGIKKSVDKMFVILPFEADFYQKYDYEVDFVGHPLLDVVKDFDQDFNFRKKHQLSENPIIALLPGSRKQEIKRMLSEMLKIMIHFPHYQFVIAGAPSQESAFYESIIHAFTNESNLEVSLIENETYALLKESVAALVTSGTATLETALFDVPQVVCYQGNHFSYLLAKRLINIEYISLVNLIVDKLLVKELIQNDFCETHLKEELTYVLVEENAKEIKNGYQELRGKLGNEGASMRTAKLIFKYLND